MSLPAEGEVVLQPGDKIVVTGRFVNFTRQQLKRAVENDLNLQLADRVTADVKVVFIGDQPGATKCRDAKRHGVPMIEQQRLADFLAKVRDKPEPEPVKTQAKTPIPDHYGTF